MMDLDFNSAVSLITIVTLLSVIVGDRVLGWLKTRGVDLSKLSETHKLVSAISVDTKELLKRFDDSTLEDAICALSSNIATQTELLRDIVVQNRLNHEEHKLILDQLVRVGKQ